jgi:amino acid transporter
MSLVDWILGRQLANSEAAEQRIGPFYGVPQLGLDGLSSAAYGPEAALTILIPLGAVGLTYALPITLIIVAILTILYLSYRQTIHAYPTGGGSYTVAKENLGEPVGLLAAASLMLDYILNVAVGIAAGVGALVSAVPSLNHYLLPLCLGILVLITLVNLRGAKESGSAFAIPTYAFVLGLGITIAVGLYNIFIGHLQPVSPIHPLPKAVEAVSLWILLRAFASGCAAMTGVEAVSNGVSAFRDPTVKNAQTTLTIIVGILAFLLIGIAVVSKAYGIGAVDPSDPHYDSIVSQLVAAVFGRGPVYYVIIATVLAVLSLSANTSFAGFPRLCRLVALDDYLPHSFANRGRRLVYTAGIMILALFSAVLLIVFGGVTDRLIPLFAIGAFLAFTLSQFGMVQHWRRVGGKGSIGPMIVNLTGGIATGLALVIIAVAKFTEGAWITFIIVPSFYFLFQKVKRHYERVNRDIKCTVPVNLSDLRPPIVVVPVQSWTNVTERAMRFALRISHEIYAVHIAEDEEEQCQLEIEWPKFVVQPVTMKGLTPPELIVLPSPYRTVFGPLFQYIMAVRASHPDRVIAVIIPELQENHWYEFFLHNQRAQTLKALLLLNGDRKISVINVAWYLDKKDLEPHEPWEGASS